jgi:phage baseplate assembly protein V
VNAIQTLPRVDVRADGASLPVEAASALTAVRVQQRLSMPAMCELTFVELPGMPEAAALLAPGAEIELGVDDHDQPLFEGQVTAIEYVYGPAGSREVIVRAYDGLHKLRKAQSVRAFTELGLRDIASEIAGNAGLDVECDEAGPAWPHIVQHRQSDLEFLVYLAGRCGLFLTARGTTLHIISLEGDGDTVYLDLGVELLEARIEVNGDPACRDVEASGWDALAVEMHHATALAQAELDVRVAREVVFRGVAQGDPALRPGTPVEVTGVHESVEGTYVLTDVTHTIDERLGYLTEMSSAPPKLAARPYASVATVGVVTHVDDPDDLGRVRVTLPTYGNVETDWLGVLCPGAGADKGLVALPDVDDHVLVLSIHGDPGRGVVLGGLYGQKGPPDSGVEGNEVQRYTLVTPGGQRLRLDDSATMLRMETSDGNYVEFTPDGIRLHASNDLTLEAPGRRITIRGRAVDFERA